MKHLSLVGLLFLSGCASIGNSDYGCTGLPGGVTCVGTRDLYSATEGGEVPIKKDMEMASINDYKDPDEEEFDDPAENISRKDDLPLVSQASSILTMQQANIDPVIDTFVTPNLPDRPVPIRTPARVMRIWVSSWEDTNSGALIVPGLIYTEIEPRRWVIGKPERAESQYGRLYKPLESQK